MTAKTEVDSGHKDSCSYAIELSKHFITLSAGGLAFTVGMALQGTTTVSLKLVLSTFALFGAGVFFGLIFYMCVVGSINKDSNYDVYTGRLRWVMLLQLLAFGGGIALTGIITYGAIAQARASKTTTAPMNLVVKSGSAQVEHYVSPNSKATVTASEANGIEMEIEPQPPSWQEEKFPKDFKSAKD